MNPTQIKGELSKMGGGANKSLGQHFLIDKAALAAIVVAADVKAGDRVLEVGPGLGVLTRALLACNADVIAIEQDRRFVEYLNTHLKNDQIHPSSFSIVYGDAAQVHWHTLIGDSAWKFVANLPYSITSLALRKALWGPRPPEVVSVLIQREVAERAISVASDEHNNKRGKTSLLSLMVALASSSARIVRRVPPGAFFPPPKVESAVLQIVPMSIEERIKIWGIEPEEIMKIAKAGFAHPRKMLASNLVEGVAALNLDIVRSALEKAGLSDKIRAEDVSPHKWAQLTLNLSTP